MSDPTLGTRESHLEKDLLIVTREHDELREANRTLSQQLERRADGMDEHTKALRKERDEALAALRKIERWEFPNHYMRAVARAVLAKHEEARK